MINSRVKIFLELIILHSIWFILCSSFLNSLVSSIIALVLTAGYINHENNRDKLNKIKRPVIWVSRKSYAD